VRTQKLSNEKGPKTISQRMQFCVKIAKKTQSIEKGEKRICIPDVFRTYIFYP